MTNGSCHHTCGCRVDAISLNVYIHFESIYCIWMVIVFDWQSIAKAGQSIAKTCEPWMQVKKTDHPNAAYRLKVNVDGESTECTL